MAFATPDELPELVRTHVERLGWQPNWKNALRIDGPIAQVDTRQMDLVRASGGSEPLYARYFHLDVSNRNPRKLAIACSAYIERVDGAPRKTIELTWAGYNHPDATILPGSSRPLDAGFVYHPQPNTFRFQSFATSTEFMEPLHGPGEFIVDYVVVSEGFPPARATFKVSLGETLEDAKIEKVVT